ncbi:MAG: argininosuccinate lyase, partial [Bacillota bacterium]
TASIRYDRRLYHHDILGSMVHARMLARQGIISDEDARDIMAGLQAVRDDIEEGTADLSPAHEDIHMNVEALLTERIGAAAGRLHTARSRNDQVATDMHLYIKDEIAAVRRLIAGLQRSLLRRAEESVGVIMPGYTHMQRAQPVLLAHHLLAYFFMLQRDRQRFSDCLKRTDISPLGSAALAGTSHPVDPEFTARELGFAEVYDNSMDAVSDRDFLLEFCFASAVTMMHLSRLGEELVLWSSEEFAFVQIDDAFATGSSIMPQKKNPDTAELIRGRTGRVYGNLTALLTVMKGLPLTYNSDMQEDKEATFDTVDTVKACLRAMEGMISSLHIDRERMHSAAHRDFSPATDAADYLVARGMPFRQAHHTVGRVVRHCLDRGIYLHQLPPEEWREFSELFSADIIDTVDPGRCAASRTSRGGTSPENIRRQIETAHSILAGEM